MVKKALLGFGMLASSVGAFAQIPVFHEGFNAEQTKSATDVAWYEFINNQGMDTRTLKFEGAAEGEGCLEFVNDAEIEGAWYQRAIKFRNLPLEPGKSYRLSWKLKGTNNMGDQNNRCKMRVGLMMGGENADIALIAPDGSEQYPEFTYFNPEAYESYSQLFIYTSKDLQYEKYNRENPLADTYFATFNIYNPGTFYLDDVTLVEAPINKAEIGGSTIRIDYGVKTNIAQLAAATESGRVCLDPSAASVTVNGSAAEIECVEYHSDGYLYIFTVEEIEEGADVKVSFTNPSGENQIKYAGSEYAAPSFTNEGTSYNEDLNTIFSHLYTPAKLVSSYPVNDSFCMPADITEFTLTFDQEVWTKETDNNPAPKAVLSNGELLTIKAGQPELSKTITFVRSGSNLEKGNYELSVTGILQAMEAPCDGDISINFEVGEIQMAQTIYTDVATTLLEGANGSQPTGWTILVGGENWTGGNVKEDNGGSIRNVNINFPDGEATAFYLCDRDGYAYMMYGDKEDYRITIPAGNIEFGVYAAGHENSSRNVEIRLEDMGGNEIASTRETTTVNAGNNSGEGLNFSKVTEAGPICVKFNNPTEQNVILKIHEPDGGYTACRILGFRIRTYVETSGDKYEPEVILEGKFTGANMPAEGSGWIFYNDNNQLTPGSPRNGTSGMLERNFHAKMPTAAFFRECGTNDNAAHRIEYGNGNGVEGGVEIEAGTYDVTYYAGTWNDDGGNAAGTSKVYMQIINAETEAVEFYSEHVNIANFKNGGDCNGQADLVEGKFFCKGGKYIIKAWGTTNTVWGTLSIIKPGSKAAQYYAKMQEAVDEAKGELEKCEDAKYDGTAKTTLTDAINLCSDPSFMHTVQEFNAAIADLKAKQDAMAERRTTMAKYDEVISSAANLLQKMEEGEAKYKNLDSYQPLVDLYNIYKDIPASTLENAELIENTNNMSNTYSKLNHMVTEGVAVLTEQIVAEAALLVQMNPEMAENEVVLAVGNALTDDQTIANQLKAHITKAMYEKIAAGEDLFSKYDEDLEITDAVTLDLTCYIQNPKPYCLGFEHNTSIASYPGWTASDPAYNFRPDFAWSGTWQGNTTPNHYVNKNTQIGIGWTDSGVDVWNMVTGLPVGKYVLSINTMDRSGVSSQAPYEVTEQEKQQSYIYYQIGDEMVQAPFNVASIGEYYNFTEDTMDEFEAVGETTADIKIGAYIHAVQSFAAIQNVKLQMVGKKEGFDYAAAAEKIAEEIAAGVEDATVEAVGEPTSVSYYDLSGKKVSTPMGITIKVELFKNGFMKVSKFVAK